MKKNVFVFGLISGLIITGMMLYSANQIYHKESIKSNDFIGYAALIVAFSFIYIGIKNFRDKYNNGTISFGKAFKIGLLITLVASTMYVGTWLIDYYLFKPEFIDKYITCVLDKAEADGANQVELDKKASEMANFKEMYKNPLFVVLISYAEVFPIGLIISLISALILKRKIKDTQVVEAT
jgi:Protein of unknown function (DUF4199)